MAPRHASFCVQPGCSVITPARRCPAHAVTREQARANYSTRRWYRTHRWKLLRRSVLLDQAYRCATCGHIDAGLEVDHVRKHGGDLGLFWARTNLQALCRTCHQRKTQQGA